jgi:hypothetical protein
VGSCRTAVTASHKSLEAATHDSLNHTAYCSTRYRLYSTSTPRNYSQRHTEWSATCASDNHAAHWTSLHCLQLIPNNHNTQGVAQTQHPCNAQLQQQQHRHWITLRITRHHLLARGRAAQAPSTDWTIKPAPSCTELCTAVNRQAAW